MICSFLITKATYLYKPCLTFLQHLIIMVIYKCYFSREHIALSYKKWCEHRIGFMSKKEAHTKLLVHAITATAVLHHHMSLKCCIKSHRTPATLASAHTACLFSIDLHTVRQHLVIVNLLLLLFLSETLPNLTQFIILSL